MATKGDKKRRPSGKRKDVVFSVSVRTDEMEEIGIFLDKMQLKTGFRISRNEFMRRAALSHIRFSDEYGMEYDQIFKTID